MSCFKLPTNTLNKLSSARNRFWWSGTLDSPCHGIHWVKKEQLERDKVAGGLGFKNLEAMNIAMLAKQCWRLLTKPQMLMCRTLKVKYFPSVSLLEVDLRHRPSYVWRSIWSAKGVVMAGIERVGAGEEYIWTKDSSLEYTTKSGYKIAQHLSGSIEEQSDGTKVRVFWNRIWKLQIPSKIKFFYCRLFFNCLPVATNLVKKGCDVVNMCKICGYRGEDAFHVFLECWWATSLWSELGFSIREDWASTRNLGDMLWDCSEAFIIAQLRKLCGTLWLIWNHRNKVWHGDELENVRAVSITLLLLVRQWASNSTLLSTDFTECLEMWQPPKEGFLKINCDGSLRDQQGRMGLGIVARDCLGIMEAVKAECREDRFRVVDVEGEAMMMAMKLASSRGWRKVLFKSDSLLVVDGLIRYGLDAVSMNQWGISCLTMLAENMEWSLHHTLRVSNECANMVARKASLEGWRWDDTSSVPWIFEDISKKEAHAFLGG